MSPFEAGGMWRGARRMTGDVSARTPWWIFAIIGALAAIPPLQHAWVWYFPPEGFVPTGMLTGDNAHHILSMRAFANGFYSPFATCDAPDGPLSWHYFATPFFVLYGIVGELGRMLGLHEFLWLGIANGLCGAIYLWCAWRFLRVAAPDLARTAFLLFTLGGGLGGIVYLASMITGAADHPLFERAFFRFAQYGIIEGQYLSPLLHFYRLYYTVPLALGLAALTALIEAQRMRCRQHLFFACFLAFFCGLIQLRVGVMVAFIGLVIVEAPTRAEWKPHFRQALLMAAATGVGCLLGALLLWQHPAYRTNVAEVTRESVHLLPLLYASLPLLVLFLSFLPQVTKTRVAKFAFSGWFCSFAAMAMVTLAHVAWHGAWLFGGDSAAAEIARYAGMFAFIPGILFVAWKAPDLLFRPAGSFPLFKRSQLAGVPEWTLVWLLIFLWFGMAGNVAFSPQRLMVLTGLPLALVAAGGLALLPPRWSRIALAATLFCGITSIGVGALFFQGPMRIIFHDEAKGLRPYGYLDYSLMPVEDARLMERLGEGVVLAPPWSPVAYSEVLSLRPNAKVLGGPGAMNIGNQNFAELNATVYQFFNPETPTRVRRHIIETNCVEQVYFPHAGLAFDDVRQQLLADGCTLRATEGQGVILDCSPR